jgi:hypothetical protein
MPQPIPVVPPTLTPTGRGYRVGEPPVLCSYCDAESTTVWYHPDEVRDVESCVDHYTFVMNVVKPMTDLWWTRAYEREHQRALAAYLATATH